MEEEVANRIRASAGLNFGTRFISSGYATWQKDDAVPASLRQGAVEVMAFDGVLDNTDRRRQNPNLLWKGDEEVERIFRDLLAERQLLKELRPKKIVGPDYEHEFPYAWKNSIWHTSEAVSFDLMDSGTIIDKANRWLGRAVSLNGSEEKFKVYLLLGKPHRSQLKKAFTTAENILNKMPCEHEFIREEEAESFAKRVREELEYHDNE